ncbi:tetratricopeptide repeat protein [candidate division KSB1 bacterium]|nr:tetratricopeptide repeat protein [candidate division KSB1 bacterium]
MKQFWGTICALVLFLIFLTVTPAWTQPRIRVLPHTETQQNMAFEISVTATAIKYVALTCVPLLALLFAWPTFRAWLHALGGNYDAAIRIYEKKVARQPSHLRLYLTLAHLYLLAGRHDQRAVTAYVMIRLLHFASSNAAKNAPVATAE